MEVYIGIGFIFLCLAVLVGMVGIVKCHFSLSKEKVEISPVTEINQSNKTTDE